MVPMGAETRIRAAGGEVADEAVFYKVSKPNASYTLQAAGDKGANWV